MAKQTRAAFYARYSTDMQSENSIADQFRNLQRRADAEVWKVVLKFSDKAMSGTRTDRPEFQRMLEAAKAREFDVLLIEGLDRLSRDLVSSEQAIRAMEFVGIRIVGISDGFDTAQKGNKLTRAVRGAMNESYIDDLIVKVRRGLEGKHAERYWTGGRPYGYALQPILDGTKLDPYGKPARVGTKLIVLPEHAENIREIFRRFGEGQSERAIAGVLNERGVPSPGTTWNRKVRRASGWMGSSIREMTRNDIYRGKVVWNKTGWVKDPATNRRVKRMRPEAEWISYQGEELRIVSDELWARAAARIDTRKKLGPKARSGYKPRFVLSGLLRCGKCEANFVMCSGTQYACSSFTGGGESGCENTYRINRKDTEQIILDSIHKVLLHPDMVAKLSRELTEEYEGRLRKRADSARTAPRELVELDERLARLRLRLKNGDEDLQPDELQAAIAKVEQKRLELLHAQQPASAKASSAKVFAALPNAARLLERKIQKGLSGNPEQAAQARMVLRDMVGGFITLNPTAKGLVASSLLHKSVLIKAIGSVGSGGRI